MRYGVIADVHANLQALDAAIAVLEEAGAQHYLCAGDLVGYGPSPNECVARLAEIGVTCVAGNHDLIVLGRLSDARCIPLARRSLVWTRAVLAEESVGYLSDLPATATIEGGVAIAHGSWDDPQQYVRGPLEAAEQLRRLRVDAPSARILILGHTHRPLAYGDAAGICSLKPGRSLALPASESFVLNPGSVGQSRTRGVRARAMLLDCDRGLVTSYSVAYDTRAARAALDEAGLPAESIHLRPPRLRDARRALRGVAVALCRGRPPGARL